VDVEDAVARPNTQHNTVDIKLPSMVKKTAIASHSRPALLLLPRIRSTAHASASHSVHQYERTIEMMIVRSLAPVVGPRTPNLTGRMAGSAVARSLTRRGAAAQRDAPCFSATCAVAISAGVPCAIGPTNTNTARRHRSSKPNATLGKVVSPCSPTSGQRINDEDEDASACPPHAGPAVSAARGHCAGSGGDLSSRGYSRPPTLRAAGCRERGVPPPPW
jgi:hypothetical protein